MSKDSKKDFISTLKENVASAAQILDENTIGIRESLNTGIATASSTIRAGVEVVKDLSKRINPQQQTPKGSIDNSAHGVEQLADEADSNRPKSLKDYYNELKTNVQNGNLEQIKGIENLAEVIRQDKQLLLPIALSDNANPEIFKILIDNGMDVTPLSKIDLSKNSLNENQGKCLKLLAGETVDGLTIYDQYKAAAKIEIEKLHNTQKDFFIHKDITAQNLKILIETGMSVNKLWTQVLDKKELSENNKKCIKLLTEGKVDEVTIDKNKIAKDIKNPPLLDLNMTPHKLKSLVENGVSVATIWDDALKNNAFGENNVKCFQLLAGETVDGISIDNQYEKKITKELKDAMEGKKERFLVDLINKIEPNSLPNIAETIPQFTKLGANINGIVEQETTTLAPKQRLKQTALIALIEKFNNDPNKRNTSYSIKNYIACINSLIDKGASIEKKVKRYDENHSLKEVAAFDIMGDDIKNLLSQERNKLGVEIRKNRVEVAKNNIRRVTNQAANVIRKAMNLDGKQMDIVENKIGALKAKQKSIDKSINGR